MPSSNVVRTIKNAQKNNNSSAQGNISSNIGNSSENNYLYIEIE